MSVSRVCQALCAVAFAAVCQPVVAQEKDELWDITVKMEMVGMPMQMPAQTSRQCIAKGAMEQSYVPPSKGECKTVDAKRTGNKYNFKMICEGKDKMTGVGELTFSDGSYDGRTQMTGTVEGQPMSMVQSYAGKRVGSCTVPPKAK